MNGSAGTATRLSIGSKNRKSRNRLRDGFYPELNDFIRGLYLRDLLRDGVITRADIRRPSDEVIERFLEDSQAAIKRHRLYPDAAKHKQVENTSDSEWAELSETANFSPARGRREHQSLLDGLIYFLPLVTLGGRDAQPFCFASGRLIARFAVTETLQARHLALSYQNHCSDGVMPFDCMVSQAVRTEAFLVVSLLGCLSCGRHSGLEECRGRDLS